MRPTTGLPIESALPELARALESGSAAVLQAPPGAGKTTVVPLALLDAAWLGGGRIVMLEPRRLAARAAAHRMSTILGERVGETVGYRVRMDSRVSARTRVEVVTEGVLTRFIHADPTLEGIAAVIFDEFHERSLAADLGLALTLQTQRVVRPELRVLVMSATLDGERVARLLGDAPVVSSAGQTFPVETIYSPPRPDAPLAPAVARVVREALANRSGDVLVFLPGAREIRDVEALLTDLPSGTYVVPLFGTMALEDQDLAIAPAPPGRRKVVLATSIAETSLTIEGVRVVVDAGLARVPRFSPRTGMTRLETVRVTRAAADQRRGRAGRVAPGTCYRLWHEHETAQLLPHATPEILEADLAPLALDLAIAGVSDPRALAWLDEPPAAALAQARELLRELEALDQHGRVTPHGTRMAALGTHPRLAHLLLHASQRRLGALGSDLAALLGDRDVLRGDDGPPPSDIRTRLELLRGARGKTGDARADRAGLRRARAEADRWRREIGAVPNDGTLDDAGALVSLAYPDRVAKRRAGSAARFVFRGGGGGTLRDGDPLAHEPFLAVAETDGARPESRIYLAAPVTLEEIEREFAEQIETRDVVEWDGASGALRAERERRLGEIVLSRAAIDRPDPPALAAAIRGAVEREGLSVLPWTESATAFRQRLAFLHAHREGWPAVDDTSLVSTIDAWLGDQLAEVRRRSDFARLDLRAGLERLLDWRQRAQLDELAPTHVTVPTGSRIVVDYSDPASPVLAVRLQEMFGCRDTPAVLGGSLPLTLHLLSPAQRPVQVTRDLAGFWRSAYFDVRKDLKGRYPKHEWPDDPLSAAPTRRTKRRV